MVSTEQCSNRFYADVFKAYLIKAGMNLDWIYRIKRENLGDNLTEKIFRLTKLYNRI